MIDLGISKLALIGAVALVVIGPEKLPKVARTVGALLGKAQRYVADVKAEVNRSMELEELRKMKDGFQDSINEAKKSVEDSGKDFEKDWNEATGQQAQSLDVSSDDYNHIGSSRASYTSRNSYAKPKKRWRAKRAAVPQWFKARSGQRSHIQSGAARVARFRPSINRIAP